MYKEYLIDPVAKPRMTRRDKWKKRNCVVKYFNFKDEVKDLEIFVPDFGSKIIFEIPVPESWSNKKKMEHIGRPHKSRPDIDNYLKGLFDAIFEEDSHIWNVSVEKVWGKVGKIIICEKHEEEK